MINNIDNNSIVICSNEIKKYILLENKFLKNIKFITIDDFIKEYYGTYKNDAIYYLMKKNKISYDVAKIYLDNIFYNYNVLDSYYNELKENNLLIFNDRFKKNIENKKVYVIGYYNLDSYLLDLLNRLNAIFIVDEEVDNVLNAYQFNTQREEINFVAQDIIKNYKDKLKDVCIVNVSNEYVNEIKRIFKMYHLPININDKKSIYSYIDVQKFINNLTNNDLNSALNKINNVDIKNKIIDIINKYNIDEIDEYYVEIINNELKNTYMDNEIIKDAINVISIDEMYNKEKYYYIVNFNQGVIPKTYYDDEFIKDKYRKNLGLNTSKEKYINNKNNIINKLKSFKNITISYKLSDYYNEYLKSPLLDELGINIIDDYKSKYCYSEDINKLKLAEMLDNYTKFNIIGDSLNDLYTTYKDNKYLSYDNKFKGIDKKMFMDYLKDKIYLSYTSVNNYFHCSFRYYVENILRLNPYEESFDKFIGDLFHHVLAHMYDNDFDLKKEYNEYLDNRVLNDKEKFFINKLYNDLVNIIDTIKKQDHRSNEFEVKTEEEVIINPNNDLNIIFKGYIDKIKIIKDNDNIYVSIVDYKTGSVNQSLDNINYGFNLQLPIYIYLLNKRNKNYKVSGFYLQKILNNKSLDKEDNIDDNLKLVGYTIDDESVIEKFDSSYRDSDIIYGMKVNKDGSFSKSAKLYNEEILNKIVSIVDNQIDEIINNIKTAEFNIDPKRINNKLIGCEYCKFKDLCYYTEKDVKDLINVKFDDIIN